MLKRSQERDEPIRLEYCLIRHIIYTHTYIGINVLELKLFKACLRSSKTTKKFYIFLKI